MTKQKKMKMMMNQCSNKANANAKGAVIDDDFVIFEILFRLPVKTLKRFESVCKRWRSSIKHDAQFHQLHFNHSSLGLYMVQGKVNNTTNIMGNWEYFFSAPGLIDGTRSGSAAAEATLHTFRKRKNKSFYESYSYVNGLVCWDDKLGGAVCIYNPGTREVTEWIKTTVKTKKDDGFTVLRFIFGFDNVTKKHKVIAHQPRNFRMGGYTCEVLTVGGNTWRRIDDDQVPSYDLNRCGIYVNGAIYWTERISHKHEKEWDNCDNCPPDILVVLDLGSEKFREMLIPDFIIHQPSEPRGWKKWEGQLIYVLEVDRRLALLRRRNSSTVSMWRLLDDDADHIHHCTSWTEVIITLPFHWEGEGICVSFHTIPGSTCQIMVTTVTTTNRNRSMFSAYYCNWRTNASTKVEFSGISSSSPATAIRASYMSLFTPFAESLFPVNYN